MPNEQKEQNKKDKPQTKLSEEFSKNSKKFKIALSILFAFLLFFSVYHVYYANKIIHGVIVAGANIGGKTAEEAREILNDLIKTKEKIEVTDPQNNLTFELNTSDIELEYNIENTIRGALLVGRSRDFLTDSVNKLKGLVTKVEYPIFLTLNQSVLDQKLNQIKGKVDEPAKDASYYFDDNEDLQIQAEKHGRKVDSEKLNGQILAKLESADFSTMQLPIKPDAPNITRVDLEKLRSQAEPLLEESLVIRHEDNTWVIDPIEKLEFLEINKEKNNMKLNINRRALTLYQRNLEIAVSTLPRGRVNKESEEGLVEDFELLGKGEELDVTRFATDFEDAFFSSEKDVVLTVKVTDESTDLSKYGIKELIGYGESNYAGSSAARAANLILAAERASGVLIPPGGVYSLNKSVGAINAKTGFSAAWVISSGRTVLGSGGGVCQTSTTLFRAVLDSGLPVAERHAHAYRVGYYEKDQPAGLDAAVYQPALDMKFKNDTENYVLVQAYPIKEETKLVFKIYGTSDGREVEISKPLITGVSPPPAALYQDTDTLKKGQVQQIDFAAWGGTSVFSRKVTKDGEVLFEENFRSVYRPWQAIFLVGTAE